MTTNAPDHIYEVINGPDRELEAIIAGEYVREYRAVFDQITARVYALLSDEIQSNLLRNMRSTNVLFSVAREQLALTNPKTQSQPPTPALITTLINGVNLDSDNPLAWYEYSALGAMLELANVILFSTMPPHCFGDYDPRYPTEIIDTECQLCITAAAEFVALAEILRRQPTLALESSSDVKAAIDSKISQHAREAAAIRNAPVNAVKRQFIEFRCTQPINASTIELARKFLNNLTKEERAGLTPTNGPITLARAYGRYLKDRKFDPS